ncbi:hypothetical protein [Cytobacillus gottheilii]|uniref:hypothetical protein n=1 Tax=Cytobacillus gottheilii TaxID=859144 RepID=UPI0009B99125|nr:hypothetical protein [Cytobacillus gottheilii]
MKKIEFTHLQLAVNHGEQFGGWIFHNEQENITIWYDAADYTLTSILHDSPTSGSIKPWRHYQEVLQIKEEDAA